MQSLDTAVAALCRSSAGKQKLKPVARAELVGLVSDCEAAIKVWQGYLAAPTTADDKWSIVAWIGADRGKQLHEIHLRAKERLAAIARSAAGPAARSIDLEDELIEMAYRMLKPGETGIDAAQSAVQTLEGRIGYLRNLVARLDGATVEAKTAKAAPEARRPAAKPKPKKKVAAKKAGKPKAVKKGKKSPARRKR